MASLTRETKLTRTPRASRIGTTKYGGEVITGSIDKSTSNDLRSIFKIMKKRNPTASKIESVRWAIEYAATTLREQGEI